MARKKRPEEHVNHERWLISYADFITLLFAFFTVMYAISVVNEGKFKVLSDSLQAAFNDPTRSLAPIQIGELVRAPIDMKDSIRAESKPVVADIDVFALENMFNLNYTHDEDSIIALVDIGASITNINIIKINSNGNEICPCLKGKNCANLFVLGHLLSGLKSIKTVPSVGSSNPPIIFNNVDFPEPEGPTNATNSPSSI